MGRKSNAAKADAVKEVVSEEIDVPVEDAVDDHEQKQAPKEPQIAVPATAMNGRMQSFIPVHVTVPEGYFAVLVNHGAGDIYPSTLHGGYLRDGESLEIEEDFTFFAPSRPYYLVNVYKK